jgi:arginine decarboxylase
MAAPRRSPAQSSSDFAPRIPTQWFRTSGSGTSWDGIPPDPYETFSYDVALLAAGIEDFNVVPYTSVMPKECYGQEIPLAKVEPYFHPGSVLEVIMAKIGAEVNETDNPKVTLASGVGIVWAAEKSNPSDVRNGYAAEFEYNFEKPVPDQEANDFAVQQIQKSLQHELDIRGLVQLQGSNIEQQVNVLQLAYADQKVRYGMSLSAFGFSRFTFPPPYGVE